MVRETRYLWIGNLPGKITEEKISERFSGHGKIQSVKLLQTQGGESCNAIVAFMDIKSASKAHNSENIIDGVVVETRYSEPGATISHRVPVSVTRTQHEPGIHSTVTAVKKDSSSTTGTVTFSSQRNVTGRFANKQEGYSDDKSVSSRSSFDASFEQKGEDGDHFTERGRSKQRFYPGSRGFTGKYDSGSQSHDQGQGHNKHQSLRQNCSSACSEPSTQRQHGPGQGSRSFQGSSRSRSGSRSSSSGSISSTGRSRSPSRDRTAERKKTLASAVSQPQPKDTGQQSSSSSLSQYTGILIRGFPVRSTDTSIRDGLFHEYKKYGKVTSVSIIDNGTEPRHAVVSFKKPEDAKKAMETTNNKVFFGSKITVIPHKGFNTDDVRFRPPEAEQDEYHHKATRTLFVGNLEMDITKEELREIFKKYGYIIDIDIKKQGTQASYAFVQYDDIKSVVQALRDMDGETIGSSKVKLGFGKSMPTNCVWLDNVSPTVSEKALCMSFCRYGPVTYEVIDREQCKALIYYDCLDIAQRAVNEMRGRALGGKKIQIDFASVDCQTLFFDNLERQGIIRPGDRPDEKGRIFQGQYPQGFEGRRFSYQKGRGSFGRGRGFQHGRRGYYDRSYDGSFERRSGSRYYDDFGESDTYGNDSYEQELREYYSQREREQPATSTSSEKRRESRADSPYSKSSRFTSPTDRYDERYENYSEHFHDTDSHSGDRESVRSFRSESRKEYKDRPSAYADHYPERFSEDADSKTGRDRPRGISPASSDYSYRSKSPAYYRCSHSPSPVSIRERKGKERTHRAQSPTTPTLDEYEYGSQTESSVDILSGKRDGRAKKLSKRREFSDKDGDKYDSEERTSSKLSSRIISHVSSLDSDKHLRLYHSKEDLMDIDKSSSYDKHWKSSEEPPERQKVIDAFQTMRERKLEKQRSRSASSSGSRNKHHDMDTHKDMLLLKDSFKMKSDKFSHPADVLDHSEHTVGSKVVKMDKKLAGQNIAERRTERTHKSDSEHESGGDTGPGSDVSQLEHLKLELMKELSQLEDDTGRVSANEDEEGLLRVKKHKRPRLEEVFDLDVISDPSISMKRWRDKVLPAELAVKQEQAASIAEMNKTDSVSSVQELRKLCRPLDRSKFKPIDTTQGFRKQMESLRKQEKEHLTAKSSASKAKQETKTVPSSVINMDKTDDPFELTVGDKSPEHVPTEFIPKKRRKVVESLAAEDLLLKGHRKYRIKRSEDCASSGEEGDDAISQKHGLLHRQLEPEALDISDSKAEGVKCDAGKLKLAHDGVHTHSGSKDHKTNPRIERQGSGSVFHRDRGPSEPPIIPDSPIEFSDGKSEKRIPQEPRTIRDGMKREASDLPLPRFARQFNCGVLSSPKQSPKSHVSPKGSLQSPQMSPAMPKLSSPPFSPGIHSPQTSPAIKLDSQMVLPPQMVPPPAPGDFPLLSLSSLSGSASKAMANVTSTSETTSSSPPPPPPPPPVITSVTVSPQSLTSSAVSSPLTLLSPVIQVATTTAKSTGSEPSGKDDVDTSADMSPASSSPPSLHLSQLTKRESPRENLGSTDHKEVAVTQASSPTSAEGNDDLGKDHANMAEGVYSCATDSLESPTTFALSKMPPKLDLSGSDLSDRGSPSSPGRLSLEDRIRALDEKLAQTAKPAVSSSMQPSATVSSSTPSGGSSDYRGKYRVRKKDSYNSSMGLTPLSTMTLAEQKTSEPSDFVRSILAKSSIFDQDSKRLSGSYDTLDTNQEGHLNLKEAPLQQRVGLNKSSGDGLIMYDDNAHDGLSRFLSSSSLVRQSSAPDSLAQYGISSCLTNKLSPPPPPPPTPSSLSNTMPANGPHSSAGFTYVSAVSVSPHDPRTANSVGPSAGSLLGGSSPLLPPSLSRSGSVDSGLLLHGSSAGSRLLLMNRRNSVEQIKVSSSYGLHASSVLASQCSGPPDLNKVGQYGKDQPQPLSCVNSSPTNSLPASVLMPPPALKMVGSDGLSRSDSIKRDHLPASSNREFLDPPVLKQEPKELDPTSVMKRDNSTDYSLKRKADCSLTTDSLHTSSPSKVEPSLDSQLKGDGLPQKMGSLEPEHKKLKLTASSSSLFSATSEKKSEKKLDSLTKSHSSKDTKKHFMKTSCNSSSVSSVPSGKMSEKKTDKTDAKDLQRSDKTLTSCGKHHVEKTKTHLGSGPGSSGKGSTVLSSSSFASSSSSKLEHSKLENKLPSDKSKSHSKEKPNKKDSLDKVNKEHRSSEKKDSKLKPSGSSNSSSSKGSSDGKHRGTKDVAGDDVKPKHQDRTSGGDKSNSVEKHRPQKSDAKHDSNEKAKNDKVDTSGEKNGMKKIEKQSSSGVKKVESVQKSDDKNRNDKSSGDKPKDRKERHRSGDSLSKSTKPNKCHGLEKGNDDKVKEKKVPEEKKLPSQENSGSSDKKKSTQERPKTDSKSKPDSKDKNKSTTKDKQKDCLKSKDAKKSAKSKNSGSTDHGSTSNKTKDKRDDKSPAPRKRDKSGSHSEEMRSDPNTINQEELEMLAPFLSMYELVKTRSHLGSKDTRRNLWNSKPNQSDDTESSIVNSDDESSTYLSGTETKLTRRKASTDSKPQEKSNFVVDSSTEDDIAQKGSNRRIKKNKLKAKEKKTSWVSADDSSSDSDTSSGSGDYLKFLASQQKDSNRHKNLSTVRNRAKKPISIHQYTDTEEEKGQNTECTSSEKHLQKKQTGYKSPKSVKKPAVYTSSSSDSDSGSDLVANSSKSKPKAVSKEKKSVPKSNTSIPLAKKVDSARLSSAVAEETNDNKGKTMKKKPKTKKEDKKEVKPIEKTEKTHVDDKKDGYTPDEVKKAKIKKKIDIQPSSYTSEEKSKKRVDLLLTQSGNVSEEKPKKKTDVSQSGGANEDRQRSKTDVSSVNNTNEEVTMMDKEGKTGEPSKPKEKEQGPDMKSKKTKKKSDRNNEHPDKNDRSTEKKKKKKVYRSEHSESKPKTSVVTETVFQKTVVDDQQVALASPQFEMQSDFTFDYKEVKAEPSLEQEQTNDNRLSEKELEVRIDDTNAGTGDRLSNKPQRQSPIIIEDDDNDSGIISKGVRPDNIFDLMEKTATKDADDMDKHELISVKQEAENKQTDVQKIGHENLVKVNKKETSEAKIKTEHRKEEIKREAEKQEQQRKEEARKKFLERQKHEAERRKKEEERKDEKRRQEERKLLEEKKKLEEREQMRREEECRKEEERKALQAQRMEEERRQKHEAEIQEQVKGRIEERRKQEEQAKLEELRKEKEKALEEKQTREEARQKHEEELRKEEERQHLEEMRREELKRQQEEEKQKQERLEVVKHKQVQKEAEEKRKMEKLQEEKQKEELEQFKCEEEEQTKKQLREEQKVEKERIAAEKKEKQREELDLKTRNAQQTASAVASIQNFNGNPSCSTEIGSVVEVPQDAAITPEENLCEPENQELLKVETTPKSDEIEEAATATRVLLQEELGFSGTDQNTAEVEIRTAPTEDQVVEVVETMTLEPVPTEHVEEQIVGETTIEPSAVVTEVHNIADEVEFDKMEQMVKFSPDSSDGQLMISQESTSDYDIGSSLVIDTQEQPDNGNKANVLADDVPKFSAIFNSVDSSNDATDTYNNKLTCEDQKENKQLIPNSESQSEIPKTITTKGKSQVTDVQANVEQLKANPFQFDVKTSLSNVNMDPLASVQLPSKGSQRRGRGARGGRGGRKTVEEKKCISSPLESGEYHLDAKTGFLSTLTQVKELGDSAVKDAREVMSLTTKGSNFEEDDCLSMPPVVRGSPELCRDDESKDSSLQNELQALQCKNDASQDIVPSSQLESAEHDALNTNMPDSAQEQKDIRTKRTKAKKIRSDIKVERVSKDDQQNDISPKISKQGVPPHYELPVLRKRSEQTLSVGQPSNAFATNADASGTSEKFSSRGRKIIPKERGDEVTCITRKIRRSGSGSKEELEPRGRGRRGGLGQVIIPEPEVGGRPKKTRKMSLRSSADEDGLLNDQRDSGKTDDVCTVEPEVDNADTPETKSAKRRRSQRRLGTIKDDTEQGDREYDEQEDETSKEDIQPNEGSPKIKRGRKPKGRKPEGQALVSSPRAQSPRSKSIEAGATSPKASDKSKPFVKLEKLNIEETIRREEMKKDEDGNPVLSYRGENGGKPKQIKDLYEWQDEDEPIPEYTHVCIRKRNESPRKPSGEKADEPAVAQKKESIADLTAEPEETKPLLATKAEALKDPVPNICQTRRPSTDSISEKTFDVSSVEKVDTCSAEVKTAPEPLREPPQEKPKEEKIEHSGRHLPLKLEMKKEAARAEAEAAVAAAEAEAAAKKLAGSSGADQSQPFTSVTMATTPVTPSWVSNMDKVIEQVAKGNFERGESFDFYKRTTTKPKRGRSKNKEEQLSPRLDSVNMSPVERHQLHSDTQSMPVIPPGITPLSIALSIGMNQAIASPVLSQVKLTPTSPQQPRNGVSDIVTSSLKTPGIQTPVSTAIPSSGVHATMAPTVAGQPGDGKNPMHALMRAGYRVSADSTDNRAVGKSKSNNDGLIKTPPATLAGQSAAVHVGVVTSQAYSVNQRGDIPQGQTIEKVPNPHVQLSGQSGISDSGNHIAFSSQGRGDQPVSSAPERRDSQSSRPDSRSSRPDSRSGWPEGLPHTARPESHPGRPDSYPGRPESHPALAINPGMPVNPNIVGAAVPSFIGGQGEAFIPRTQPLAGLHPAPDGFQVRMMQPQPQSMVARQQETPNKGVNSHGQTPQHSPSLPKEGIQQPNAHFAPPLPPHIQGHPFMSFPIMMSPGVPQVSQPSPPMSQASELRAALAQPSKLVKQEQMMQRIQQCPTSSQSQAMDNHLQAAPQDSRHSPSIPGLGQHRMPFTFQEPRSAVVSRAEPKNQQGQNPSSHVGPKYTNSVQMPQSSSSAFSQPDIRMPMPADIRPGLTHPDARPGIPQQMYPPGLQAGMGFPSTIGLPPGIVLPGAQHEYLTQMNAHPGLPALVPPPTLLAQQSGATPSEHHPGSRPPSRRTSSPSQLSPRVATPHQAPTPNPQGAAQPIAHPGSTNVPPGTLAGIDHRMDSMLNLLQRYPVMWQGQLGLKNDSTAVQMHFVAGNKDLIPGSLPQRQPDGTVAPIRIVQRMRLEQTQLEGVAKRMQNEREYSMMLAVPCGRDVMDIIQQSSFLKDGFIKYLQEKQAAGIVNVPAPGTNQTAYVVHIFPPCEFSEINVSRLAPDLLQPTRDVAYLLIIVATC